MLKRCLAAMLVLTWVVFLPAPMVLGAGGPRTLEVTGAACPETRAKAEKQATEACAKVGGLSWTEYSADCEEDTQFLPGVPVTLQVHFLCGADL